LEFNVPFQHKYGYIRDDLFRSNDGFSVCAKRTGVKEQHSLPV